MKAFLNSDLTHANIDHILVSSRAGSPLDRTVRESIILAVSTNCLVMLNHNGRTISIDPVALVDWFQIDSTYYGSPATPQVHK